MPRPQDPTPESPQSQDISLDALTEAFAQAMGTRSNSVSEPDDAAGQAATPEVVESADSVDGETAGSYAPDLDATLERQVGEEDPCCPISPISILEAMLFVGNREDASLSSEKAAELMRGVAPDEMPLLVEELNRRYADSDCPYKIIHSGPGFRLALRERFASVRNRFYGRIRQARLSQAAVEVLALVAYRQPLTSDEVSRLRGTPSGHLLTQLVRRRLLRVERSAEKPRGAHYYTTHRFLDLFALESLDDLPLSEEIEKR